MEKPIAFTRKCSQEAWLAILTSLAMFSVLFCFDYSSLITTDKTTTPIVAHSLDPCFKKYIYVHELPPKFNFDIIKNCRNLTRGISNDGNMCPYLQNNGLGIKLDQNKSWYNTNQFTLEVIFHSRMLTYKCLTKNPAQASAVFVPFYAGLDASLRLWNLNLTERDSSAREVSAWLARRPEWSRLDGRDHFLAAGRIAWDFRRRGPESGAPAGGPASWGTALRFLPEGANMSMLSVEASSWRNDHAVPYPTNYHPSCGRALLEWQDGLRVRRRSSLFAFAGAPRTGGSVRDRVLEQCRGSRRCLFVDCSVGECGGEVVVEAFGRSVYCLQPAGDSYTRRSVFDSIVAGCIPVFFHPGTAYSQYRWHLPRDPKEYSVFMPAREASELGDGAIERALLAIPKHAEVAMRDAVINLIPRVIYAGPGAEFEDAFDVAVDGFLRRVEEIKRLIREGKDPAAGFADEDSYKFTFSDWNTTKRI